MKARTSPTSPKYVLEKQQQAVSNVWRDEQMIQPQVTPWTRIFLLTVFFSLLTSASLVAGWVWYARQYPQSLVARFLPAGITTTVVTPVKEKAATTTPKAVTDVAATIFSLAADRGSAQTYTQKDLVSLAMPLSSNGWLLAQAWPNPPSHLVALPLLGNMTTVQTTVTDPASSFIFFKTDEISQAPVSFAFGETLSPGMPVWVLGWYDRQATMTPTQLIAGAENRWASSDHQSRWWALNLAIPLAPGSPVVDSNGQLLGVVGAENKVWPIQVIEPILKQIVQTGTIERAVLGLSYLNRGTSVVSSEPTAQGALIGADDGNVAVTAKSPADKVNLRASDIITGLDDQPMVGDLFTALRPYHPGDKVVISYVRQGVKKSVTVQLATL